MSIFAAKAPKPSAIHRGFPWFDAKLLLHSADRRPCQPSTLSGGFDFLLRDRSIRQSVPQKLLCLCGRAPVFLATGQCSKNRIGATLYRRGFPRDSRRGDFPLDQAAFDPIGEAVTLG